MEKESKKGLQTVKRAVNILNTFTNEDPTLSLTQISNKIGLPKSTTARMIETLIDTEMMERVENSFNYKLGHNLYILGRIAEQSYDIIHLAKPIMRKLRDETGESVSLYKIFGDKRMCIERFTSTQPLSHNVTIGTKLELGVGAAGKALLSFQDDYFIKNYFKKLENEEQKQWLISEMEKVNKEFVSVSYDERGAGVNAVAAPIFTASGTVKYSIGLSGPSVRFTRQVIINRKERILKDANIISQLVGYEINK